MYCWIERTFRKSSNFLVCSISFHSRTFHWGKLAGLPLHLIDVLPPLSQSSETSVRLDFRPIQTTQELGLAGFQFDFWIDLLPIFARLWPPKYYYNYTRLLIPPATQRTPLSDLAFFWPIKRSECDHASSPFWFDKQSHVTRVVNVWRRSQLSRVSLNSRSTYCFGSTYSETSIHGHLRDLPRCPLNSGCKNCAMFVNDEHSTVTLYCDKVACC